MVWELYGRKKFNDDLLELLTEIVERLMLIEGKLEEMDS
tara:strand:+ start:193 stop:309 length:117 start_codon:yes stop_codon:yes gene_type:complete